MHSGQWIHVYTIYIFGFHGYSLTGILGLVELWNRARLLLSDIPRLVLVGKCGMNPPVRLISPPSQGKLWPIDRALLATTGFTGTGTCTSDSHLKHTDWNILSRGPANGTTLACAPIEDSDQTARLCSLIWVFDGCSICSQGFNISLGIRLRLCSDCVDVQTEMNLHCICMQTCTLGWIPDHVKI